MLLIIQLTKEVPDVETGQMITNIVIERLNDHPEVNVDAHISNHLDVPEPPPE